MKTAWPAVVTTLALLSMQTAYARDVTRDTALGRKSYNARNYRHAMFSREAAARVAGKAAWGEIWNRPKEWGRGAGGLGRRLASGFATHAVRTSIEYGVGHALHEQMTYHKSEDPRFRARLKSAFGNTFLAYHGTSTKRGPAVGRISGAVGAGLISRLWQPTSVRTVAAGMSSAGIALGADFGINLAREYIPSRHRRRVTISRDTRRHRAYHRA